MKCKNCGQEIKKTCDKWFHEPSGLSHCEIRAMPTTLMLYPNSWCTGQEWVDAGGALQDFFEAHQTTKSEKAEVFIKSLVWRKRTKQDSYDYGCGMYRIMLNENAELPKGEPKKEWHDEPIDQDQSTAFSIINKNMINTTDFIGYVYENGECCNRDLMYTIDGVWNFYDVWTDGYEVVRPIALRMKGEK